MKATIDQSGCIACGVCVATCPSVFRMGDNMAEVFADPVPKDHIEHAMKARDDCPVSVIDLD